MIEVQSYYQGYDKGWNWGTKVRTVKLSNRCHTRLVREARQHFDDFGIDFTQYGPGEVLLDDDITAQVTWTHKKSGRTITLTQIWFNKKTGEINQCGSQYGNLVS